MNIVYSLIFIGLLLISNLAISQEFTADPVGEGFQMMLRGKRYPGMAGTNYNGNILISLNRSDDTDRSILRFNANPQDEILQPDWSYWDFGLRNEDNLGIYYIDGPFNFPSTKTALVFNPTTAYASFGSSDFFARVTVKNDLYGQKGIYSTAEGDAIYAESVGGLPVAGYGVYGKSRFRSGVHGESELSHGVSGQVLNVVEEGQRAGVYGAAIDFSDYGVYGYNQNGTGVYGKGGTDSYGVVGHADYIGVFGSTGHEHPNTRGVLGSANAGIGVRGTSTMGYGVMGVTNNSSSYAGYFEGDVFSTGSYLPSDRKLKQNEQVLAGARAILDQLRPVTYEYQDAQNPQFLLPQGKRYGLIAQELEQVLPHLVKETRHYLFDDQNPKASQDDMITFKAVNYLELIPILIAAVQEQSDELETVKKQYQSLLKQNQYLETQLNLIDRNSVSAGINP